MTNAPPPPPHSHSHASPNNATIPPALHALAGAVGSALALTLLYPLERARIELWQASSAAALEKENNTNNQDDREDGKEDVGCTNQDDNDDDDDELNDIDNSSYDDLSLPTDGMEPTVTTTEPTSTPSENNNDNNNNNCADPSKQQPRRRFPRLLQTILDLSQRGELYTGVGPIVTTLFVSNFIFFGLKTYAQQQLRRLVGQRAGTTTTRNHHGSNNNSNDSSPSNQSVLSDDQINWMASTAAGIGNVLLTNPLWVTNLRIITTQQQPQPPAHPNLWTELVRIGRTESIAQLWQGTTSSLWLVSNPVLQMVVYERLRRGILARRTANDNTGNNHNNDNNATLSPATAFVVGALAKALSTVVTYPLQLAQACQRLENTTKQPPNPYSDDDANGRKNDNRNNDNNNKIARRRRTTTLTVLRELYRQGGIGGWYTGLHAKLVQTVLTAALQFLTYEQILRAIHKVWRRMQQQQQQQVQQTKSLQQQQL